MLLNNYLTIAIRNIRKAKGYALINVLGLAIGMACVMLILLYIQDELSYDRYHGKSDHIYRLTTGQSARSAAPLGPAACCVASMVQTSISAMAKSFSTEVNDADVRVLAMTLVKHGLVPSRALTLIPTSVKPLASMFWTRLPWES